MAYISSITNQPSIDVLVNRFMEIERAPVKKMESTREDISKRITSLTNLKTKLKTLYDRVKSFTEVGAAKKLGAKSAESSNSTIFTAQADSTATLGVNTIFVSQIAKNDTVVSDRITSSGTDIAGSGGTVSFSITVGAESAITISVEVDATETNSEVLTKVKDAINSSEASVSANVISDTSTTKRLTIVSDETGSSNAIELKDLNGGRFLKDIGMVNGYGTRKSAGGTYGGYIESDISNLNAIFTLNGIQIESNSNEITDVLTGVTLTLKKAQSEDDQPETLVITQDEETVKEQIQAFIKDYNDVIKYLNENTSVNPTTYKRGIFAGDFTIRQLKIDLRTIVSGNVSTVESGNPANLTEIGISIDRSGLLSLEDEDEFSEALEEGASAITDLFDSAQGIAVRIEDELEGFVTVGGTIDDARSASNLKVRNIEKRESSMETRLRIKEASLRKEFAELQKTLSGLTSQSVLLRKFGLDNIYEFGYDSGENNLDLFG